MGGLDFGRGFYLTSSYEQAYNYVQLSVRKAKHIGGKIADDQTARTLQIYISGEGAGEPGTPKADKETIEKLLPNRLKDQFCFRTQDVVEHLEFIRSDRYGDIKL